MNKIIVDSGIDDILLTNLLDYYQMFDCKMNWEQFIEQIKKEINEELEKWKQEEILEEE